MLNGQTRGKRKTHEVCKKQVNPGVFEKVGEILVDENRKYFLEKVKLRKCSTESEQFSEIGGSETGGNASLPQAGWMPLFLVHFLVFLANPLVAMRFCNMLEEHSLHGARAGELCQLCPSLSLLRR